ncbi:MAG: RT0821/Lpp0805 family surface protein [bacterium]|nr:RT0821/Lpp0805 family surface protein [bacterium]
MTRTTKSLGCIAIAALLFLTVGCENIRGREKEFGGTAVGAALGGLLGSQFGHGKGQLMTTAVGALAGAWLGNEVGRSLDRADRISAEQTAQRALDSSPDGRAVSWRNPNSGHSGAVMPTQTYQMANGNYCREFQQVLTVGGKQEQGYGTACRQQDGSWKIVQ